MGKSSILKDTSSFDKGGQNDAEEKNSKQKLSYMEKRELDQLIKDINVLEKERDEINDIFDHKDIPYDDIKILSEAL
jgi:hypothetical protein